MGKQKVFVVTGGARGIGKALCEAFAGLGAAVCTIDLLDNDYFIGDIAEEKTLRAFVSKVLAEHGSIDVLVNNACVSRGGLDGCSWEDFNHVLKVGVSAPYLLTRLFMDHFRPQASVVNIASTRGLMSQAHTESYSAAKGGIMALTHSMAVSLSGKVRVNCVSPGWIDTGGGGLSDADHLQHPVGRAGRPDDIVQAVLFLCDPKSGFITGQNLVVDGGMTRQMIYHNDAGWTYSPGLP